MTNVAIAGSGRMGQAVAAVIGQNDDLELAGIWRRGEDLDALLLQSDVIIDFSMPDGTEHVVAAARRNARPLVCGVTGLGQRQLDALRKAASKLPVLYDRNMSLGVAVLQRAVFQAARDLGSDFEVEIAEVHHAHKKDAPSGTALKLGDTVAAARGSSNSSDIRFSSERRGEVPGDHDVLFSSPTETLRFRHSAKSRQVFAEGAVRAARWLLEQAPGLYSVADILKKNGIDSGAVRFP
jgi:4-hydroxy-tetrahydrodipicolinate reductase